MKCLSCLSDVYILAKSIQLVNKFFSIFIFSTNTVLPEAKLDTYDNSCWAHLSVHVFVSVCFNPRPEKAPSEKAYLSRAINQDILILIAFIFQTRLFSARFYFSVQNTIAHNCCQLASRQFIPFSVFS